MKTFSDEVDGEVPQVAGEQVAGEYEKVIGGNMQAAGKNEDAIDGGAKYSFSELQKMMLQNNPTLKQCEQEIKQSLLDVKNAKANLSPTIDFQAGFTYLVNPPIAPVKVNVDDIINSLQWQEGFRPTSTGQYLTLYEGLEDTLYTIQFTLQQPVFTWGKITNGIKLYNQILEVKKSQMNLETKKLNTELETRLTALWYLYKIAKVLEEENKYAGRLVKVSEDAQKAGLLLAQDVLEARIQAKELDIALQDVNEQIKNNIFEIEKITGVMDLSQDSFDYEFDESFVDKVLLLDRDAVEINALNEEQDSIKILSHLSKVNDTAIRISKASVYWKPDFALSVTAGYGGSRFPLLEENYLRKDDYTLNFTLGLKTCVWDGGKKLNEVSRSISSKQVTQIKEEDAKANIRKTLQTQWNTCDVCVLKIDYQKLKIETTQSKILQEQRAFESGYGSETELLTSQIKNCNEQIELLRQKLNLASSCFMIYFLYK